MKICVAGAGAGKTTKMAQTIIEMRNQMASNKIIFCITFTNNAVACIEKKLSSYYGEIPPNIKISTIHSFLYQEFIKPYYFLLYNKQYRRISTLKLPLDYGYKNMRIRQLEENCVLHQTKIPERAKWVVSGKSKDNKAIKDNRKMILQTFSKYCGAICIDEAQDMDKDMATIFTELDTADIEMQLVGDPKQDLKGNHCFKKMIESTSAPITYISECHRCPQTHLKISNLLVPVKEQQCSCKKTGHIQISFVSDCDSYDFIFNGSFDLKYISEKQGIYDTHLDDHSYSLQTWLFEEIEPAIIDNHPHANDLSIKRAAYYYAEQLIQQYEKCQDASKAMASVFSKEKLSKKSYATIIGTLSSNDLNDSNKLIGVSSINSIKGQEGNNCLFILTTDVAAYLFGNKKETTATKNRLYVALTRSLNDLTIYILEDVENTYGRDKIEGYFKNILGT